MKKWQIVLGCMLISLPVAALVYRYLYAKPQPEDLAGETKPIVTNR